MGMPVCTIEMGGRFPGVQSWMLPPISASPARAPPVNVAVETSSKPASFSQPFSMATMCGANTGSRPKPMLSLAISTSPLANAHLGSPQPVASTAPVARKDRLFMPILLAFMLTHSLDVAPTADAGAHGTRQLMVRHQVHDADQEDAEDGNAELAELSRFHNQVAHTALGRDQLGRHQNSEGEPEADPQPRGDVGQGRRDRHPPEQAHPIHIHGLRGPDQGR